MVNCRSGPKWASIGLAQDAWVGVKHSLTLCFLAQRGESVRDYLEDNRLALLDAARAVMR
jgi:hypothetical protein